MLYHALVAVLYILTGLIMVNDPLAASAMLTMFIGILLLMVGILRAVSAIQHRSSETWVWSLLSGLAGILIG